MVREERIILSEEISGQLTGYLNEFLDLSLSKAAFLITKGGQLLKQQGISEKSGKLFTLVSLISGIFSSTQKQALMLGELEFKNFYQEGRKYSIYYSLLVDPFVLVSIFDERAILGDIQLRVEQLGDKIKEMLSLTIEEGEGIPFFTSTSRSPEEAFTDLFDLNL